MRSPPSGSQPAVCLQGFGKASNRVGMARPKKKVVVVTETVVEDAAEAENETGVTGELAPALDESDQTAAEVDASHSSAEEPLPKKYLAALEAYGAALEKALSLRRAAGIFEEKEKLAKRLFDAKMRRLDNGGKRKKRKSTFGAAQRGYEAIIALNEAQLKSAWCGRDAAEAERDAARAELRVSELM